MRTQPRRASTPALATVLAIALATGAQAAAAQGAPNLADLSLEQLSNLEVTSAGKRGQRLSEVAASVYVIRGEDIRRSGATTLPEALRLAPNLFVARAGATQYAITARTGADVLSNKMLVLVDGRTVYSPLFSGVFWEAQAMPIEDVDRIEVLSGSGGTLYGSNAFHGVINVITRSAQQTGGALVSTTLGSDERVLTARYGVADEGKGWRLYARRGEFDRSDTEGGPPLQDASRRNSAGFRSDRGDADSLWTVDGQLFSHRMEDPQGQREYRGGHLLARYVRTEPGGARTQWQAYIDRFELDRTGYIADTLDTFDVEVQSLTKLPRGHLVLWGGGWRHQRDRATNRSVSLVPPHRILNLGNVFVQDEWTLDPVKLTLGVKAEHNSYTGMEFLPNARVAWEPVGGSLVWGGWSRVVRTPARIDRDALAPPLLPSPNFDSEVAHIVEVGYRGQLLASTSFSATLFHHDFARLRSFDAAPGGGTFNNNVEGTLTGIEAWGEFRPAERWRLQAGFVHQRPRYHPVPGSAPLLSFQGNDPRTRITLQASWDITPRTELFVAARHVSGLPQPSVPSYTSVDVRFGWHATPQLEVALLLRNLAGSHVEWSGGASRAEFDRSALLQATWRY